jgi:hypothetical protein
MHRASLSFQSAFCREETERAKCDHRVRVVEHSKSLKMPRSEVTARPTLGNRSVFRDCRRIVDWECTPLAL